MFVLYRAIVYASFFVGVVLVYVPARFLAWSGIVRPESIGEQQVAGMIVGAAGAGVALWCILTFGVCRPPLSRPHLFIIGYEEPTLRRMFGQEYEAYCNRVRRMWPGF